MLNIVGNKAKTLAALYNNSRPLGMGFLHYDATPMNEKEAQELLNAGQTYFDYLKGRVMKINLEFDFFDTRLYDLDNGEGSAAKALESI